MFDLVSDQTTTLDIVTLIVAIVGVSLAAASLGWQAATFVLSGSRVDVRLRRGWLRRELGVISHVAGPVNPSERDITTMREQGFADEVAIAEVRNRGRLAISVENVTVSTEDGWGFGVLADPENPKLPHRLEPGAKEAWHVELKGVQMLVDGDGKARGVGMDVEFGTGKVVRTERELRVFPRASLRERAEAD